MAITKYIPTTANRRTSLIPFPDSGNDGSTLSLDFTKGVLDPRLTFSRSTTATFINSNGLVQYADHNLVFNSTMLVSTPWTPNTSGGGTVTINNDNTVTFSSTSGRATWLQSITIQLGLPVTFSIEVTALTNTNIRVSDLFQAGTGFTSQVYNYTNLSGNTTANIGAFTTLPGIGLYTVNATTTATSGNVVFGTDCNGVTRTGNVTIARPQLQYGTHVSNRVYLANSSTSAANTNTPRFDYNPTTLTPRGLLMEGGAINLAARSDDFNTSVSDGSQWVTNTYISGTLSTTLPDGTTGNARRISVASGSASFRSQTITVTANTAYTWSFWARNNGGSQARYRVWNVTAGSSIVDYTLSGSDYVSLIGGANNTSSTWVRVSVSFTTPAGCTSVYVYPCSSDSGSVDLLVWGAQLELGVQASSYIPTGASTVQRTRDEMTMANISALNFNPNGGTVFMQLEDNPRDLETYPYFAAFEQSPSGRGWCFARFSNFASVGRRVFGIAFKTNNSTLIASSGATRTAGQYKFATTLDTSLARMAIVVNGGGAVVNADTAATLATIGSLKFNNTTETGLTEFSSVWMAKLKYWPVVFPNSTLVELTK